ncbi:GLUG motif-containing protein [Natronospora cellulosivora (SeqCode)]
MFKKIVVILIIISSMLLIIACESDSLPDQYNLNIQSEGKGHVDLNPELNKYPKGTTIKLTAKPVDNWEFTHWSGDINTYENPYKLEINKETNIKAIFSPNSNFLPGKGDSNEPYEIYHAEHLSLIGQEDYPLNSHYKLINDIDMEGIEFTPIETFQGVFDGKGFAINNLYINMPDDDNIGLFSINEGSIKNLQLNNAEINGNRNVGTIAGINEGVISNITVKADVSGESRVGGLVGSNVESSIISNSSANINIYATGLYTPEVHTPHSTAAGLVATNLGIIEKSFAKGKVTATDLLYVGGLVGCNYRYHPDHIVYIFDSYASVNVSGNNYVGGLVGSHLGIEIKNSYATGKVQGSGDIGGLIARSGSNSIVNNSYWDTETTRQESSAAGEGKERSEMQSKSTYEDWDFDNIWAIDEGEDYPYLQWEEK